MRRSMRRFRKIVPLGALRRRVGFPVLLDWAVGECICVALRPASDRLTGGQSGRGRAAVERGTFAPAQGGRIRVKPAAIVGGAGRAANHCPPGTPSKPRLPLSSSGGNAPGLTGS